MAARGASLLAPRGRHPLADGPVSCNPRQLHHQREESSSAPRPRVLRMPCAGCDRDRARVDGLRRRPVPLPRPWPQLELTRVDARAVFAAPQAVTCTAAR
jgi:hypothetical protein